MHKNRMQILCCSQKGSYEEEQNLTTQEQQRRFAETENLAFSIGLRLISSSRTDTICKRGLRLHRRISAKRENYFALSMAKNA
jgi:hypothetical protein